MFFSLWNVVLKFRNSWTRLNEWKICFSSHNANRKKHEIKWNKPVIKSLAKVIFTISNGNRHTKLFFLPCNGTILCVNNVNRNGNERQWKETQNIWARKKSKHTHLINNHRICQRGKDEKYYEMLRGIHLI